MPVDLAANTGAQSQFSRQETLDLRDGADLPPRLLRRLDEVAVASIGDFNAMVGAASRGHERNIDWWVSRPITRNNHISEFYVQCMQLALIRVLLDEGSELTVIVDSPELATVLAREPRVSVVTKGILRTRGRQVIQRFGSIVSTLYHCALARLAAKLTHRRLRTPPQAPISIINTFVYEGSLATGQFRDRYFPGLLESFDANQRERVWYLPVFYRVRHYLRLFRSLRNCGANFLFYEDHATLSDYGFAVGHWWRLPRLLGKAIPFAEFDVGPIFDADARHGRFASIVPRALLAYRFYAENRFAATSIAKVLDWYEGLDLNHAIAAGINWHQPGIKLTGFRSAGSLYYASCTPAPHEAEIGVVPPRLAVVGTGLAKDIQIACPQLDVSATAGLRYTKLLDMARCNRDEPEKTLLLALPLSPMLAVKSIQGVAEACTYLSASAPTCWVKSHPALPKTAILAAFGGPLPAGMTFVDGDFYDWLRRADYVAGTSSSALMEAVAIGVPTICLAIGNIPTEAPVPAWVSPDLSRIAYGGNEIADAIRELSDGKQSEISHAELHIALLGYGDIKLLSNIVQPEPA